MRACESARPSAAPRDDTAIDVHSPVAGVVRGIETRPVPGPTGEGTCIVIENDGSDELEPGFAPIDWASLAPHELLARIRSAGIAGLGGAAFPAHAKLAAARERSATHLVLNGAECEPWICCDDALMRERAADVVLGAQVLLHACGAAKCTIAVEDDKPEAIAAIEVALAAAADPRVGLATLRAIYPAGAERQLLAAVTGLEVPHDALPPAIGLVCQNVGTAAAAARLVRTGQPITGRIVTVTGSGVREPANLDARLGTPIADLVAACGGYDLRTAATDRRWIHDGPGARDGRRATHAGGELRRGRDRGRPCRAGPRDAVHPLRGLRDGLPAGTAAADAAPGNRGRG